VEYTENRRRSCPEKW